MVKYYFQSLNGTLAFVCAGTKKDLEEKVKKEFSTDKEEVEARLNASIADAENKLNDLLNSAKSDDERENLEKDIKIATLKKGIYDARQELARVGDLMKADLVFFEMTPVELDI